MIIIILGNKLGVNILGDSVLVSWFSVLVRGELQGFFQAKREIRQGTFYRLVCLYWPKNIFYTIAEI